LCYNRKAQTRFDAQRHLRNREIVAGVSFEDLCAAWAAALSETRRARR
jgi:hypothetical protein